MNDFTLVGPGKKFATIEDLERGKIEADTFIQQLEQEQARLREELDTRLSYEEFLDKWNTTRTSTESQNRQDNQTVQKTDVNSNAITPQDIERIVEQRERRTQFERNKSTTLSQYVEVNGPNHAQKLKQQATELGMSESDLQTLAGNNPKAFAKLVGLNPQETRQESFSPPPRSTVNMEAFASTNTSANPLADQFKSLYKSSPSDYWSPRVQNQIHKLVAEGRLSPDDIY